MATRRNALGRGLDALIPNQRAKAPATAPAPSVGGGTTVAGSVASSAVREESSASRTPGELAIDSIAANPDQPRRVFDDAELAHLADSIARHGVLQPVVVRKAKEGSARPYELVVGERRWRASQLAGRERIPATILDVAPRDLLEIALIENVQRQDLNPIELAQAFRELMEEGATQEQVGQRVGMDRSTVSNHLRLLDLPRELQGDVEGGAISMGHAKALLAVTNPERRRHLRDRIVGEQLSVRGAEQLARQVSGVARPPKKAKAKPAESVDPNLQSLIDLLRERLQTQVRITGGADKGKIELDFYSPEDLHRITQSILDGGRI